MHLRGKCIQLVLDGSHTGGIEMNRADSVVDFGGGGSGTQRIGVGGGLARIWWTGGGFPIEFNRETKPDSAAI
jgi:hypothetical protein